ncbi:MAG: hypothetical protein V3S18_08375 [Dehalococcoidia bacterium]
MEWDAGAAVLAGLAGTAVMTVVLYMGRAMMPRQMPMNILHMEGTMVARANGPAYMMGAVMHFGIGVIFALVHTGLYNAFDLTSGLAGWGILFGAVHWVVAGMGMGMMGSMHPLMRSGEMDAPGFFLRNFPSMTVMGFFMLHLLYGLIVGVVYEAAI